MTYADDLLNEIELHPDSEEAVGMLAVAIDEINREIENGDKDRIRRLVNRLRKAAQEVARAAEADRLAISVGLPRGVSATLEWEARRSRDGLS